VVNYQKLSPGLSNSNALIVAVADNEAGELSVKSNVGTTEVRGVLLGAVVPANQGHRLLHVAAGPDPAANGDALVEALTDIELSAEQGWAVELEPGTYALTARGEVPAGTTLRGFSKELTEIVCSCVGGTTTNAVLLLGEGATLERLAIRHGPGSSADQLGLAASGAATLNSVLVELDAGGRAWGIDVLTTGPLSVADSTFQVAGEDARGIQAGSHLSEVFVERSSIRTTSDVASTFNHGINARGLLDFVDSRVEVTDSAATNIAFGIWMDEGTIVRSTVIVNDLAADSQARAIYAPELDGNVKILMSELEAVSITGAFGVFTSGTGVLRIDQSGILASSPSARGVRTNGAGMTVEVVDSRLIASDASTSGVAVWLSNAGDAVTVNGSVISGLASGDEVVDGGATVQCTLSQNLFGEVLDSLCAPVP
jgi:hypothetical protein